MQLGVFAAPRNEGIWDEVRAEIAESMRAQRGGAKERAGGEFGTELTGTRAGRARRARCRSASSASTGRAGSCGRCSPARRPTEAAKARRFEEALRHVVVVRGTTPLPVREPVPLTLPKEMAEQLAEAAAEPAAAGTA